MRFLRFFLGALSSFAVLLSIPVLADSVGYTYDSLGRLARVEYIGGPNNGRVIEYHYDASGNRTSVVRS